ncbi:X-linked retinitis pigmentosa GTPase regulator-interacting protein 1-like [Hetaerina americana]|uniref:X-linked retinitis pigmentosa GTPase regulator-interacting protein 1-like n=1 Tax=Hetaerina americana TaxID=62018 RepID=UPI003A7F55FC
MAIIVVNIGGSLLMSSFLILPLVIESPIEGHEFGILQYRFQINCDRKCVDYYKKKKIKDKSKIESTCNGAETASSIKEDIIKFTKKFIEKTKKKPSRSNSVDLDNKRLGEHNAESEDVITPPKPAPRSLNKSSPVESPKSHENNPMLSPPQISIEVHSLWIVPECSVANDPNIHQLFVEYSFLGKGGENLETPVSLPKTQENEKLNFNFKRVFSMDPVENLMERNILRNMINMKGKGRNKSQSLLAKGKVRFNVVSEPLSDDDSNAECIDVGYADINIPKILLDGHDMVEDDIPIMNSNGTNEVIGFLNVSFLAYDVLKTLNDHHVR